MKNKSHIAALAGAFALVLAGTAAAQRDDQTRQDQPQQRNNQTRTDNPEQRNDASREESLPYQPAAANPGEQARPDPKTRPDPGTTGASAEYAAELKKCDRLDGAQRTQCIQATMKRFGQM